MKLKQRVCLNKYVKALIFSSVLTLTSVAQARLVAYEGFWAGDGGKSLGATVVETSGGYGWADSWSLTATDSRNPNRATLGDDRLEYTGFECAGEVLVLTGPGDNCRLKRSFAEGQLSEITSGTNTIWLSCLHYKDSQYKSNSFILFDGEEEVVSFAARSRTAVPANTWALRVGTNLVATSVSANGYTAFILARIDLKEGADDVHVWISDNFDFTQEPSVEDSSASILGEIDFSLTGLALFGESYTTDRFDEIRVATTFEDAIRSAPPKLGHMSVSELTETTARLNGDLEIGGSETARIYACWGVADGGNDTNAWDHVVEIGSAPVNEPYSTVIDITSGSYCYRFYAENEYGVAWTPTAEYFGTLPYSISVIDAEGDETIDNTMSFRVERSEGALGSEITVFVDVAGTATNGEDYDLIDNPLELTLGATDLYADMVLTPKQDLIAEPTETIVLTLLSGGYLASENNQVVLNLADIPVPSFPTNVWCGVGDASDGANWSLGLAPTSEHIVLLEAYSTEDMNWDLANPVAGWVQGHHYTGQVTVETEYTGDLIELSITGDMSVLGGSLTHLVNETSDPIPLYRLNIDVAGNLIVGENVHIHGDSKGFPRWTGLGAQSGKFGALYGGQGGIEKNGAVQKENTYGSILFPVDLGSGASYGGNAGGAVVLSVAGHTQLDGKITANDVHGEGSTSGGSVLLTTSTLSGTGALEASGGSGKKECAGSGGRIAIHVLEGDSIGDVEALASPGVSKEYSKYPWTQGAAGTVYITLAGERANAGQVYVDTADKIMVGGQSFTHLPPTWSSEAGVPYSENLRNTSWNLGRGNLKIMRDVSIAALTLSDEEGAVELGTNTLTVGALVIDGIEYRPGTYSSEQFTRGVTGLGTIEVSRLKTGVLLMR